MFSRIIKKDDWELTEIVSRLYNNKSKELCFNGTLTKNNNSNLEQSLQKRLIKLLNYRKDQIK